jgi:hypothetical protein
MMTMQKELATWVMGYSQCCRCALYLDAASLGTAIPVLGFCAADQVKAGDEPSSGEALGVCLLRGADGYCNGGRNTCNQVLVVE